MIPFKDLLDLDPQVTGVDIGASGGIACRLFGTVSLHDMPSVPHDEYYLIRNSTGPIYAEDVHPFKGQGVVAVGSLMQRKGRIEAFGYSLGRELKWIEPMAWIECFTLKSKKNFETRTLWKKHLLEIARGIEPMMQLNLKTADAFLIWIWAAHKELGHSLTKVGSKIWA